MAFFLEKFDKKKKHRYTIDRKIVRRLQFMERKITSFLQKWKKDLLRKPLLLYGSKQIGKTYSVLDFGTREYKNTVYFDTDNYRELLDVFTKEKTIDRIILNLSLLSGETIFPSDTLIILDNVNDNTIVKGIKLFGKEKNDYHIVMITSRRENLTTFKGEELQYKNMFKMDFEEFLWALEKRQLADYIRESYRTKEAMPFHAMAHEIYLDYLRVGGMPEAVLSYCNKENEAGISTVHQKVLDTYQKELSVTNTLIDITRSIEVLKSIPYQFLKENKKFQYGIIGTGKRSKEYDTAIDSITTNQLSYRSYKVTSIKSPLTSCRDKDSFKLYLNDTGLLYTMLHLNRKSLMMDANIRDILYENDLATSLVEAGYSLNYYQSEGKAEVSFIIQNRLGEIIPIELASKNNAKSKSLSLFLSRFTVKEALRITEDNFKVKQTIYYIPVYATFCLKEGAK